MRRFLKNLKTWGLLPEVVVTDGSNLYPAVLAELWPQARHQLCVFHVLKDIHKRSWTPCGGCAGGWPGGATGAASGSGAGRRKARARRRGLTQQGEGGVRLQAPLPDRQAAGPDERAGAGRPGQMLSYLPELRTLRDFVDRLEMLFEEGQSEALAWGRHAALLGRRDVPGGARVGGGD